MIVHVASPAECEEADAVVCVPASWATPFDDNETGACSRCGVAVQFRPHAPRICIDCLARSVRQ